MDELMGAMDLKKGNAVDYRYENGRFLLCEIQSVRLNQHNHSILYLHPMGVQASNSKHDRVCNLFYEYYRVKPAKSVSLRTVSVSPKNQYLTSLHVDSYIDINPVHRKGHEGWKHGRIIKMDANSSQVKVFYNNERDHFNYSYWFHLEDTSEIAPFQSKYIAKQANVKRDSMIAISEISEMEQEKEEEDNDAMYDDMYDEVKSDHYHTDGHTVYTPASTPPLTPALCPKYSSAFSMCSDHHQIGHSGSHSLASTYSIDHHSEHEHDHINHFDPEYKQNESMLHQLANFGYDAEDIQDAMEHVSNPSDINQIVDFMSARDLEKISQSNASSARSSFHVKPVNEWKSNKMTPGRPKLLQSVSLFVDDFDEKEDDDNASESDLYEEYPMAMSPTPSATMSPRPFLSKSKSVFGANSILMKSTFVKGRDYGVPIPDILIKLKEALFANRGHLIAKVFGIAADNNQCEQIQSVLNDDKLKTIDLRRMDVVLIATLIKVWFERLPKRILHDVDMDKMKQCENIHDAAEIIQNHIGEPNESYFKWLLDLCVDVVQFEKTNKMSVKYMATVFGPALFG